MSVILPFVLCQLVGFKDCKWARANKSLNQGVFGNINDAAMVE
jgi:hypothetical protein